MKARMPLGAARMPLGRANMSLGGRSHGMSLVEILVTIFVLAIGLLAVIRVLIPGLSILPHAENWGKGSTLAQDVARRVESHPDLRADSVEHAVRDDIANPASGWTLFQDVSMGDPDQLSPTLTAAAGGDFQPLYPNLFIGERFATPLAGQVYLVDGGPYRTGSLRVYYPEPWVQVEPGAEFEPGTFSAAGTNLVFGPGSQNVFGFMACYSTLVGGQVVNVVGEVVLNVGVPTLSAPAIPYSVSLYELAEGIAIEALDPELGRAGAIQTIAGAPEAGTILACTYEVSAHLRGGFDESMRIRYPEEALLSGVEVPDIMVYECNVPLNNPPTISLPFRRIAQTDVDGNPIPLDATGPESVRVVDKVTGAVFVPPAGSVTSGFLDVSGGPPAGTPVRVYYRVAGNWSLERHVAAAEYSMYDPVAGSFVPSTSQGLKQNWYALWTEPIGGETYTGLVFHNVPGAVGPVPGRAEEYWDGGPLLNTRSDGHRIAVDYRYAIDDPNNPGGQVIERVTGETHLVDFSTHAFMLDHPRVVQIDAVRGISYKVRACFDDNAGHRSRVDVDTLAMR